MHTTNWPLKLIHFNQSMELLIIKWCDDNISNNVSHALLFQEKSIFELFFR